MESTIAFKTSLRVLQPSLPAVYSYVQLPAVVPASHMQNALRSLHALGKEMRPSVLSLTHTHNWWEGQAAATAAVAVEAVACSPTLDCAVGWQGW